VEPFVRDEVLSAAKLNGSFDELRLREPDGFLQRRESIPWTVSGYAPSTKTVRFGFGDVEIHKTGETIFLSPAAYTCVLEVGDNYVYAETAKPGAAGAVVTLARATIKADVTDTDALYRGLIWYLQVSDSNAITAARRYQSGNIVAWEMPSEYDVESMREQACILEYLYEKDKDGIDPDDPEYDPEAYEVWCRLYDTVIVMDPDTGDSQEVVVDDGLLVGFNGAISAVERSTGQSVNFTIVDGYFLGYDEGAEYAFPGITDPESGETITGSVRNGRLYYKFR